MKSRIIRGWWVLCDTKSHFIRKQYHKVVQKNEGLTCNYHEFPCRTSQNQEEEMRRFLCPCACRS